jgi:catechol 2,3-dioxygenase-like lactoylglutathione lyase family enzyme
VVARLDEQDASTPTTPEGSWKTRVVAITGVHTILYTDDAAADRAFFADVLGLPSVDAGDGWLIFALPPAALAAHPASADGGGYEPYLMCDDIEATVRELAAKGVEFSSDVTQQRWGLVTTIKLPGGGRLGLYEPLHASPLLSPR